MFERGSPRGMVAGAAGVAHKRTAAGFATRRRGGVRGRLRCGIRATPRFGPGSVVAHRRSAGRGDECLRSGGRSLRGWNSVRRYQDRVQPAVPTRAVPPTAEASVMTKTMTARGPRVGLDLQASRTNGPVRCRADGARTLDRPITIRLAQISAEAIALRHCSGSDDLCCGGGPPSAHDLLHPSCHAPRVLVHTRNSLSLRRTCARGPAVDAHLSLFGIPGPRKSFDNEGPAPVTRCAGPIRL
jgi:hypothetical protein